MSTATAAEPTEKQRGLGKGPQDRALVVTNRQLLVWMFQFLKPVIPFAAIAASWLAIGVGIEVIMPRQMGRVIDLISHLKYTDAAQSESFTGWLFAATGDGSRLRTEVLIVVGLVAASCFIGYLRSVSAMKFSMHMVFHLREAVYDKLQRVGFTFHDAVSSGQLINRALTDLNNVRVFLQTCVLAVLEIVLIVGGFIILLMSRQPWVALISLVPLPIWLWYILRFSKRVQPTAKAVMEAGDRNVQIITENIAGVHVVKAFATEKVEIEKYHQNATDFLARIRERIAMFANFNPVIRGIAMGSQIGLTIATAIMIIDAKMTLGDFLIVGWAMGAILGRLQQVAAINEQYQNAIVSARRLHEVLTAVPAVHDAPDAKPLPPGGGGLAFDNVTFGYDPNRPVLRNVSFVAPPGKMIAIVGPTGSGKSTLVSLVSRFYDPQGGRILVDGVDIRTVSLQSLRSQITYVFQETFLFSDTVANNIAYGDPDATEGDIEIAARLAQAHEFIEELPKSYATILAERGSSLSGGQRQRLAIARAIVKNPRILVLDDATAAVDSETEELIRKGMRFAMQGRTTFVIAHRLSTVQAADLVVVLENGEVTQIGTHQQLLREDGHYRDIAAVQLRGDTEAEKAVSLSHMKRVQSPKTFAAAGTPKSATRSEEAL